MLLLSIAANCVYLMCNLRSFIFCIAAAIHNYWKFLLKDRCSFFQLETIFWQMARTAVFLCVKQNKKPCHCTRHDIIDVTSQDLGADILLVICLYSVSYQHLLR